MTNEQLIKILQERPPQQEVRVRAENGLLEVLSVEGEVLWNPHGQEFDIGVTVITGDQT